MQDLLNDQLGDVNDLKVDDLTISHFTESAKWAKFIAIAGFIFSTFCIIVGAVVYNKSSAFREYGRSVGTVYMWTGILYVLAGLVWITTSVFQIRFANKLLAALLTNNQITFIDAWQDFKTYYRISGVVTIICLIVGLLAFLGILSNFSKL